MSNEKRPYLELARLIREARQELTGFSYRTTAPEELGIRMYLAAATPREERIEKLEAQIEKMKRCFNCKYHNKFVESKCGECEDYSKWELAND